MRIYVASRLRGADKSETVTNIDHAIDIGKWIITQGQEPLVPHVFALIFDDSIPFERKWGMALGEDLLYTADELWAFGPISPGMQQEINIAVARGIPVHFYQWIEGAWHRREILEITSMKNGEISCSLCGKGMDPIVSYLCRKHGRVCPECWSWEYGACQVCADKEYAEEVRYERH